MVNWKEIQPSKIAEYCQEYFSRYNEYPSVRELFYRFVDELWPNTNSVYKTLSRWLRDHRLDGKIDWRLIRDGSGREYETGDWTYRSPREHVSIWLDLFAEVGSRYDLPMWLGQPKKVIVACEKEADYPVVKSILSSLNVDTFYERGYSGWRPLFEAAEEIQKEKKTPIIIALGDFDPSGEDIVRFLKDAFIQLGFKDIEVEKVSVTKGQIEKFGLPHRPEDAKEIAKLQSDSRFKKWPYGLYRVETAALRAKAPDYFDKILQDTVLKHFDQEIHAKIKEHEEELRQKINEFFEEQSDLINELRENIIKSRKLK